MSDKDTEKETRDTISLTTAMHTFEQIPDNKPKQEIKNYNFEQDARRWKDLHFHGPEKLILWN